MKTVWIIFTTDKENTFPNFFPIGVYSSKKMAEKQLVLLPRDQPYHLFEFPVDSFTGEITEDGKGVKGMLGRLVHTHFKADKKE